MNFFQRRKILKKLNYLEATPIRKSEHRVEESGLVTLVVPKFKNKKLLKLLHPRRRYFNIALDETGSTIWLLIDGQSNVEIIIKKSEEILGEKLIQAQDRITKFLTMLYNARYITYQEIEK